MKTDVELPISLICREVLEEKTARYRRNVIALSVLALILWFVPSSNIEDARAFGVGLGPDASARKFWGNILLVSALFYNAAMFFFYAYRDGRIWIRQIKELSFKKIGWYFADWLPRLEPNEEDAYRYLGKTPDSKSKFTAKVTKHASKSVIGWDFFLLHGGQRIQSQSNTIKRTSFYLGRQKLIEFWTLDITLPFILGMLGIFFTACAVIESLSPPNVFQVCCPS